MAVTAEGISLPADQQQVLARSVTMLLLLNCLLGIAYNTHGQEAILFFHDITTVELQLSVQRRTKLGRHIFFTPKLTLPYLGR